ncbi:NAD-dependent epimerase/dehydratase family protein [Sodalis glossinidius]|nr:NAD-dependent epimerase/dehydratase family protein [Sodalis glossinidius]
MTASAVNRGEYVIHGGQQWRPFIHCRDVAKAITLILDSPEGKVSGKTFNIGDDQLNMTLSELGNMICGCLPDILLKNESTITDNRSYRVSFGKIRDELGFSADYDISRGIREIEMLVRSHMVPDPDLTIYSNVKTLKHNLP